MFSEGLSAKSTVAAAEAKGEFSGYLYENARSLYRRVTLAGRKKLRVELSGLHRDADLVVSDAAGNAVESGHRKTGTEPEVFLKDLAGGEYLIAINRKSGAGTVAPFELVISSEAPSELSPANIATARENAKPLSFGVPETISAAAGVSYFYFDPPPELRKVSLSIRNGYGMRTVVEDTQGSVLLTRDRGTLGTVDLFAGPVAGRMYIRIEGEGEGSQRPEISVALGGDMPLEEFWFPAAVRERNWHFVIQKRECYGYTYASDLRPAVGWLKTLPFLVIKVTEGEPGAAFIGLVHSSTLAGGKPVTATVTNSKGKAAKVQLAWHSDWLKPVAYNKRQKQYLLNNPVIRQIVGGSMLEISGLAPNGSDATLRFNLAGMRQASDRIVKECKLRNSPFR